MLARRQAELRIVQHVTEIVLQKKLLHTLLHVCQRPLELGALPFADPLAKSRSRTRSSTELLNNQAHRNHPWLLTAFRPLGGKQLVRIDLHLPPSLYRSLGC